MTGLAGSRRQSAGFTLLELLLVAVLVSILSAVSVPVLNGVVSLAYRVHADQILAGAATELAGKRLDTGTFRLQGSGDSPVGWQEARAGNPFWRLQLRAADRTGFLLTATRVDGGTECPVIGWDHHGRIAGSPVCRRSRRVPVTGDTHVDPDLH